METLFWKVIHNKYLFKCIIEQIHENDWLEYTTDQKQISLHSKKRFKEITALGWMIEHKLYPLINCKLDSNQDIDISYSSVYSLFEEIIKFEQQTITNNDQTPSSSSPQSLPPISNEFNSDNEAFKLFLKLYSSRANEFNHFNFIMVSIELDSFKLFNLLVNKPYSATVYHSSIARAFEKCSNISIIKSIIDDHLPSDIYDSNKISKLLIIASKNYYIPNEILDLLIDKLDDTFKNDSTSNLIEFKKVFKLKSASSISKLISGQLVLSPSDYEIGNTFEISNNNTIEILSQFIQSVGDRFEIYTYSDIEDQINSITSDETLNDISKLKQLHQLLVLSTNSNKYANLYISTYSELPPLPKYELETLLHLIENSNQQDKALLFMDSYFTSFKSFSEIETFKKKKIIDKILTCGNVLFYQSLITIYRYHSNKKPKWYTSLLSNFTSAQTNLNDLQIEFDNEIISWKFPNYNQLLTQFVQLFYDNKEKIIISTMDQVDWIANEPKNGYVTNYFFGNLNKFRFSSITILKYIENHPIFKNTRDIPIKFTIDFYIQPFFKSISTGNTIELDIILSTGYLFTNFKFTEFKCDQISFDSFQHLNQNKFNCLSNQLIYILIKTIQNNGSGSDGRGLDGLSKYLVKPLGLNESNTIRVLYYSLEDNNIEFLLFYLSKFQIQQSIDTYPPNFKIDYFTSHGGLNTNSSTTISSVQCLESLFSICISNYQDFPNFYNNIINYCYKLLLTTKGITSKIIKRVYGLLNSHGSIIIRHDTINSIYYLCKRSILLEKLLMSKVDLFTNSMLSQYSKAYYNACFTVEKPYLDKSIFTFENVLQDNTRLTIDQLITLLINQLSQSRYKEQTHHYNKFFSSSISSDLQYCLTVNKKHLFFEQCKLIQSFEIPIGPRGPEQLKLTVVVFIAIVEKLKFHEIQWFIQLFDNALVIQQEYIQLIFRLAILNYFIKYDLVSFMIDTWNCQLDKDIWISILNGNLLPIAKHCFENHFQSIKSNFYKIVLQDVSIIEKPFINGFIDMTNLILKYSSPTTGSIPLFISKSSISKALTNQNIHIIKYFKNLIIKDQQLFDHLKSELSNNSNYFIDLNYFTTQ